jgi:formylglycine-generating enzyme required for sulfatase activity
MPTKLKSAKWPWLLFFTGIITCAILLFTGKKAIEKTSSDDYCISCHIHPDADAAWKKSAHYYNQSGVRVHCVECHLPPKENNGYLLSKAKTGMKDLYSYYFKDHKTFDWENKGLLEHAVTIVSNESCIKCHQNLYTKGLSTEGGTAHLYYEKNAENLNLQCINCHLDAGHYNPNYKHEKMKGLAGIDTTALNTFTTPAVVTSFADYMEQIPKTKVSFKMIAIKGGTFKMGSPEKEAFHKKDEAPVRTVTLSPFFMGEVEVSWDEYWAFFASTMSEGRVDPNEVMAHNANAPDAVTGPTPPFGIPDQGWGGGKRPAITMTHYAATVYCQWLSKVTGKHYRLPTEAEWEYACRAGSETPYFFPGDPKKFSDSGLRSRLFGSDTTNINRYAVYLTNAHGKTQEPNFVKPNTFGLKNMLGNVLEYCSDWYSEDAYSKTGLTVTDPKGPSEGKEHVVRGGNYNSDAKDLRSASRDFTKTVDWLRTDPQQPKSIWWYSDIKGIGFRVVCEPDKSLAAK